MKKSQRDRLRDDAIIAASFRRVAAGVEIPPEVAAAIRPTAMEVIKQGDDAIDLALSLLVGPYR